MIQQPKNQKQKIAQADPMLHLAELLIKINKREKVVELPTEGKSDESDQRSSDNSNQAK